MYIGVCIKGVPVKYGLSALRGHSIESPPCENIAFLYSLDSVGKDPRNMSASTKYYSDK